MYIDTCILFLQNSCMFNFTVQFCIIFIRNVRGYISIYKSLSESKSWVISANRTKISDVHCGTQGRYYIHRFEKECHKMLRDSKPHQKNIKIERYWQGVFDIYCFQQCGNLMWLRWLCSSGFTSVPVCSRLMQQQVPVTLSYVGRNRARRQSLMLYTASKMELPSRPVDGGKTSTTNHWKVFGP